MPLRSVWCIVDFGFFFLCRLSDEKDETTFKETVGKFVSSIKEYFKEIEEASAELKQQAVTGVIGIEASKVCWEQICRKHDHAGELRPTSSGDSENEDKSFFWKGKVKTAEKYAQIPCAQKLTGALLCFAFKDGDIHFSNFTPFLS
jgi:hypothetical protein